MSRKIIRVVFTAFVVSTVATAGCLRALDHIDNAASDPAAVQAGAALPGAHASTQRYKIDISYPTLTEREAPLASALRQTGGNAIQEFLQSLPDPKQFPEFADRQLQLLIDFKIASRTNDFVSVREQGMSDTGGAHPLPIDASFVYDARSQRVIALEDLFADPSAARKRLAEFAHATLTKKMMTQAPKRNEGSPQAIQEWKANAQQMIDDGTKPTADNFSNFVVDVTDNALDPSPGLTLIFPPYQVAAYVYGTQTIEVPAHVFVQCLKPPYRKAFWGAIAN
ncbi:MAG: DUF3298 and DUF4163 domain-containing protein [Pseudomonadota bacterium]|nr:DUF3298 and DUF4163 domain-containing protein [Pseudomonadota bacterium]